MRQAGIAAARRRRVRRRLSRFAGNHDAGAAAAGGAGAQGGGAKPQRVRRVRGWRWHPSAAVGAALPAGRRPDARPQTGHRKAAQLHEAAQRAGGVIDRVTDSSWASIIIEEQLGRKKAGKAVLAIDTRNTQ